MTDIDVSLVPGCFGVPTLCQPEAKECRSCPFKERCEPVSIERLAALRAKLGIVVPERKQRRRRQ